MKTNHLFIAALLLLGTVSCGTNYRMTSQIGSDGSIYREVYARGDSAFIAGDKNHNPYMFQIDADWQIVKLDSAIKFDFWGEKEKLNVKVCRKLPVVDGEYFSVTKGKKYMYPLAIPTERVKKNFRWFYTYYTYTATYKELMDKGPVPLSNYMNKEEQIIWFCGDNSAYNGLSGMELKDKLNGIESKFGEWYSRSQYEINWEVIRDFILAQGDTTNIYRLDESKEAVYKNHFSTQDTWGDAQIDVLCNIFDKIYQTKYYSELYLKNKETMNNMGEEKIKIAEVLYNSIQFELSMPGILLSSNARTLNNNSAIWKIDGFRLLTDNYTLHAESRVINYWAFGVTLLIILTILGAFVKLYRCTR